MFTNFTDSVNVLMWNIITRSLNLGWRCSVKVIFKLTCKRKTEYIHVKDMEKEKENLSKIWCFLGAKRASLVVQMVKNLPAMQEARVRRSPGGGHGNPHQYSWLENPVDRGAWQATVHGVSKSRTRHRQ